MTKPQIQAAGARERHPLLVFARQLHLGCYNRLLTYAPSFTLRHLALRACYRMHIGRKTNLEMGIRVFAPQRIRIGDNSVVHFDAILDGRCGLVIGDCVDIGHAVHIFSLQHDIDDPAYRLEGGQVTIEDYAIVGGRTTILPGVTIGRGAVCAAGSVVTRDVEPFMVVGGVPTRVIRRRQCSPCYRLNYRRHFH